jgi:hypothetical protein
MSKRGHLIHLREVFSLCKEANLHLRLEKCTFMVEEIKTLGFIISNGVIRPDPVKIDMLLKAPPPKENCSTRFSSTIPVDVSSSLSCVPHIYIYIYMN